MRAESHPTWLPESGQRSVSGALPGSHVGCWDGLRRPRRAASIRSSGGSVGQTKPKAAVGSVKAGLLLQKQENRSIKAVDGLLRPSGSSS